jgi:short-subunit dehydrogenase
MDTKSYALITGGTSGIGYELAKVFATNGHNLILVARDEADLTITRNELLELGVDVKIIPKDLFDKQAPFELYEEICSKGYDVNILVNNAGQGQYGEFADTNIYRELSIIQLNISSLVVLTKLFLQDMIKKGDGKIMNLSAVSSKSPGPLNSVYHGTKAFVQSFTQAIAAEVEGKGINVMVLMPGATDTDFFNKADMQQSKVAKGGLEDAKIVAKDGYDALMKGKHMKVSGGFKNKVRVALGNVLSDKAAAKKTQKEQSPVEEKK